VTGPLLQAGERSHDVRERLPDIANIAGQAGMSAVEEQIQPDVSLYRKKGGELLQALIQDLANFYDELAQEGAV